MSAANASNRNLRPGGEALPGEQYAVATTVGLKTARWLSCRFTGGHDGRVPALIESFPVTVNRSRRPMKPCPNILLDS
jgi:hypothetical protein